VPDLDQQQLTKYLTDVHSIEQQALAQMKAAPDIAGDPEIAAMFEAHLAETEEHERLVRERLEARGAEPSTLKDVLGRLGGVGMIWFARSQPDTPGKLVAHAFSYEHMELAAYDLLARIAERAGDTETVEMARRIRGEEDAMASRLSGAWTRAVVASLAAVRPDDLQDQLVKYLTDAHAIEAQASSLLSKGPALAGDPDLARLYEEHLEETRGHQRLVQERLDAHGASPSRIQDAAMRLGALNWGAFFGAQPDTPVKLAGFAYAFEHLEIGGYEQLKRVAADAHDDETVRVAQTILAQERIAAERIHAHFGRAVDATFGAWPPPPG
jgi:ferritin-like metal-binding protein YciE